ncbi:MAG TPA: helix-turn-helix domain-containing protein [Ktedonobacteraceae bacterium]|nr:helix-turn-helix domain-containing protein [Ktedonobacteraceae bacterium]
MGRTSNIPPGFYSAGQAIKKLGVPRSTFYDMVERGQITKVIPPHKSDGWYHKAEIDKMARANQLFMLQYATDASTFETASEEDIEGISNLNAELFGGTRAARYDLRMRQYEANPEVFHVLKQGETVVGYAGIFPLKSVAIQKIMEGLTEARFRIEVLSPENILMYQPGETYEVFLIIGVRQQIKKSKAYGMRVVAGCIEVLETLARRGIVIRKAYATSRTQDGIRLMKGLSFKQITPPHEEDNLLRFELDLLQSSHPLLKEFQRLARLADILD